MEEPCTLTVVVPMFNELEGARSAVAAVLAAGDELVAGGAVTDFELLVVDDGSVDGTAEILADLGASEPRLRVVSHGTNQGYGAALRSGFAASSGDLVAYTDADLPFDLVELAAAVRLVRTYGADVVSMYRLDRTSEGMRRQVLSAGYNAMVRVLVGLSLRDVNFAAKLYRAEVLRSVSPRSDGLFFDPELLALASIEGCVVLQRGVDYHPRRVGSSTLSSPAVVRATLTELVRRGPALGRLVRRARRSATGRVRP